MHLSSSTCTSLKLRMEHSASSVRTSFLCHSTPMQRRLHLAPWLRSDPNFDVFEPLTRIKEKFGLGRVNLSVASDLLLLLFLPSHKRDTLICSPNQVWLHWCRVCAFEVWRTYRWEISSNHWEERKTERELVTFTSSCNLTVYSPDIIMDWGPPTYDICIFLWCFDLAPFSAFRCVCLDRTLYMQATAFSQLRLLIQIEITQYFWRIT